MDGSLDEDRTLSRSCQAGVLVPLPKYNNCYLARTDRRYLVKWLLNLNSFKNCYAHFCFVSLLLNVFQFSWIFHLGCGQSWIETVISTSTNWRPSHTAEGAKGHLTLDVTRWSGQQIQELYPGCMKGEASIILLTTQRCTALIIK